MPATAGLRRYWQGKARLILLAAVLAVAAALRWYGLDWDQGRVFHPDERFILMTTVGLALPLNWPLLLSPDSPLNPHSFAYGSLPFYLLSLVGHLLAWLGTLADFLAPLRSYADYEHLRLVGRFLAGLFDLGSVLLVYVLGTRLRDSRVGLLAASFVAVSVINVQYAHFYASDSMLTFFILLATLCSLRLLREQSRRSASLAGVAVGLAVGSKFSAAPLLAVVGTAYLLTLFTKRDEATGHSTLVWRLPSADELHRTMAAGLLTLLVAAVVFLIVEPYALIDFATFAKNLGEQNAMARGIADLPYTRQYANTPAYWYSLQNLIVWGLGPPLGVIVVAAAVGASLKVFKRPTAAEIVLLAWMVPYFAITGQFHAKFLRYLLPLVPFLALFAAKGLVELRDWLAKRRRSTSTAARRSWFAPPPMPARGTDETSPAGGERPVQRLPVGFEVRAALANTTPRSPRRSGFRVAVARIAVSAVIFVGLAGGLLYAIGFTNIYRDEHTAVRASKWIYQNVPKGSRVMTEHWEEGMPVPLVVDGVAFDAGRAGYQMLTFGGYEDDNLAKLNHIVDRLSQADYIVFFSNRLYSTIPRLPQRYPLTSEYYRLLFGERLGFRLEASFTQYASLGDVTLVEDTIGDPGLPPPARLADFRPTPITLNLGKADESFSVYDHPKVLVFKKYDGLSPEQLRGLFAPYLAQPPQAPPRPSTVSSPKSLLLDDAQRATDQSGGTFGDLFGRDDLANRMPIPVWLAMIELLGLLGAPIAFALFRHLPDRGYLLGKVLAILLLSWLDWMLVSLGLLHNTRGAVVVALAALALASGWAAWHQRRDLLEHWRSRRRLILAGEALFWAAFAFFLLIRLANPDLWHPARGGEKPMDLAYLMAAIKSATFPPYDPWFAGGYLNYYYYGQIIVASLIKLSGIVPTTAYNLVVPTLFALTAGGAFSAASGLLARAGYLSRRGLYAALCAAAFAVVFGNLGGATQLIDQIMRVGSPPFHSTLPGVEGAGTFFAGLWRMIFEAKALAIPTDWYWASTRVLEGTINEFPFFTFLYADLHAHMIALPFTMLALGLAVNAILARVERPLPGRASEALRGRGTRWLHRLLYVAFAALILGALTPVNSWDFPTYLALYALTILVAWYLGCRIMWTWGALLRAVVEIIVVSALAYLLYWPFHSNFQQWYLGVDPVKDKSDIFGYLKIHGLFLFALASFLAIETHRRFGRSGPVRTICFWLRWWQYLPHALSLRRRLVKHYDVRDHLAGYAIVAVLVVMLVLHLAGMTLLGLLFGLLVWTTALALRRDNPPDRVFVLLLAGTGMILSAAVELVAIKGDIGRMNTVFKFYLQVWMLWSVASACAIYYVFVDVARSRARRPSPQALKRSLRTPASLALLDDAKGGAPFAQSASALGEGGGSGPLAENASALGEGSGGGSRFVVSASVLEEGSGDRAPLLWTLALGVLVSAALVYPAIATRARVADRYDRNVPLTLDGMAYMATATFREENPETKQPTELRLGDDLPAMRWLQDHVEGSPVILEGSAPLYHWGARYSIYTGLPTVIGWDWHQKQQRWGYQAEIDRRLADVRMLYNGTDVSRANDLLDKYRVRYIVVGGLERAVYSPAGLAKFDAMVGQSLDVVYDDPAVKIYYRNE